MPAEPLAALQGAAALQAVEGGCCSAAEGLEVDPVPPSLCGCCGHPGGLALLPAQRSLPAAACSNGVAAVAVQRPPGQTEVSVTQVPFCFATI